MRASLRCDLLATSTNAVALRHRFHEWLVVDVPADVACDLVLAVYEAIANAAEHAYADRAAGPGPMRLEAHRSAHHVTIVVSDEGVWRAPTGARNRNRGVSLMRVLVHDVRIDRDSRGTVVHLRAEIPPADPSSGGTDGSGTT